MRSRRWVGYLFVTATTAAAGLACSTVLDISGGDDAPTEAGAGPDTGGGEPTIDGCDLQLGTPLLDLGDVSPGEQRSAAFTLTNPNARRLTLSTATTGPYVVHGLGDVIEPHTTLSGVVDLMGTATVSLGTGSPVLGTLTVTDESCSATMQLKARVSTEPYLFSGDLAFDVPCGVARTDQKVSFRASGPPVAMWTATGLVAPLHLSVAGSGTIGGAVPQVDLGLIVDPTNSLLPIAQKLTVAIADAGPSHAFAINAQPKGGLITLAPKTLTMTPDQDGEVTITNVGNATVKLSLMLDDTTTWIVAPLTVTLAPSMATVVKVRGVSSAPPGGNAPATLRVAPFTQADPPLCGSDTVTISAQQ